MKLDQVVKLLKLMEKYGLDEIEVEQGDTRIKLKKSGGPLSAATPVIATPMQITPINGYAPVVAPANDTANAAEAKPEADKILSPMVGTFYRSSVPDAEPFISEGDTVSGDSVICIIEAMKVMNEIKAETEGKIVKVLVEDGESVEYGQPLMVINKTDSA